ncbi:MAG: cytochrome c [Verrucomicrobia bacterium]|nr:MAG: cytochrome c [Verrucomicrobiota bacterium]
MSADPNKLNPNREAEPTATKTVLPVWLVCVLLMLLFTAGWTFDQDGGWFDARVYKPFKAPPDPYQPPAVDAGLYGMGEKVYNKPTCVACHQPHGKGMPGQFPSLVGSSWITEPEPGRVIRIVLDGLQGPMDVDGLPFNGAMVPWKDVLTDEEIAAVLTYVRGQKEWGNKAPEVTPERVKAVREKEKARKQSWTADEIKKVNPAD